MLDDKKVTLLSTSTGSDDVEQPHYLWDFIGTVIFIGVCSGIGVTIGDQAVHEGETHMSFSDAHKAGAIYGALASFLVIVALRATSNYQFFADAFTSCVNKTRMFLPSLCESKTVGTQHSATL